MRTNRRSEFCYRRRANAKQVERAELIGSNTATALGLTVTASAPVLALCRELVAAGHDPARLDAYRGNVLCLRVRSIGEAAQLQINGDGTGFRRCCLPVAGPPMRRDDGGGV